MAAWQCAMLGCMLLTVGFIWSNSMRNAAASTEQSGFFKDLFRQMFDITKEPFRFLYNNLRKLAHFSEFALLGAETAGLLLVPPVGRRGLRFLSGAGLCLLVAAVDEGIQLFVPGRVGSLVDIGIDGAGALCGMLLAFGVILLCLRLFKKK